MKLLVATHYYESHRGGIEIVAGRLARELQARGVDVTWLATDASPPPGRDDGCGRACPVPAWNVTERRLGLPLPLPGPRAATTIWREVRGADAVLLHDSLYPTNVLAMLAARWHRKPIVIVQHIADVPYKNPFLRVLMKTANALVTRPMLASASQVVFISSTVARHFDGMRFSAPPRLIFNGVDTTLFTPPDSSFDAALERRRLTLPNAGPIALFVGRFVEKKGLHIIERLARRLPEVTFALAGWGPIDPETWRLPNVRVFKQLAGQSLVPLYRVSDAFVLPSTGEGLPLVMQEALACGVPVICGSETARADPAARDYVDGVDIDPTDDDRTASDFAHALTRTLAVQGDQASARRARHAYAHQSYSWATAARSYLEILEGLTANGAAVSSGSATKAI